MINSFRDEYFFLSNFYECPVTYLGLTFKNNEAAFQAQKTLDASEKTLFINYSPAQAKRAGRRVQLRPDWESAKESIMYDLLYTKFTQSPELERMLLDTGDEELVEGNNWNDRYWGVCRGTGKNTLGKLLMKVRSKLRELI